MPDPRAGLPYMMHRPSDSRDSRETRDMRDTREGCDSRGLPGRDYEVQVRLHVSSY